MDSIEIAEAFLTYLAPVDLRTLAVSALEQEYTEFLRARPDINEIPALWQREMEK